MKSKLVKTIFWFLKKVDKDMYFDIKDFLEDAETYYVDKINIAIRNNEYNHIKIDTSNYCKAKLRILYILGEML